MSRKFVQPFRFRPGPSRTARLFTWLGHGGAATAALANPLAPWLKLAVLAMVAVSLWRCLRTWPDGTAIAEVQLKSDGSWLLVHRNGHALAADLLGETMAGPGWVRLAWRTPASRVTLLVFPDSLPAETYRQLRVVLRIAASRLKR